jgi:hypothetical protein
MSAPLLFSVRVSVIGVVLTVGYARPGVAQPTVESFDQLSQVLKPGVVVFVQDENGQRIKGKISALSGSGLELRTGGTSERTIAFPADRVTRVSRVDSRLNGFVIGAIAGAVPGIIGGMMFNQYCHNESADCPAAVPIAGGVTALVGGGIGYAIDGAIDGQKLVFARRGAPAHARLIPMLGDHLAGVRLSLTF